MIVVNHEDQDISNTIIIIARIWYMITTNIQYIIHNENTVYYHSDREII